MRRALLAAILSGLLCACSPLGALNVLVSERGFVRHADIAYGEGTRGKLDVYVPRGDSSTARPVVVFFYGGGWQSGRREDHLFIAEALCARGYVVVIPDYRLYPEVKYPAFIDDGARAVAWTAANIAKYGGDARALVLMGHSAGAHIAAMLAYNRRFVDGDLRSRVKAMVGLAGPYDFTPDEPPIIALLSGEGDPDRTMPARYVRGGEPPSLLVTGDADARVNPSNTERLARQLKQVGSPVEVKVYPGMGHPGALLGLSAPFRNERLLDDIDAFIRAALAR